MSHHLSILIPTFNRAADLGRTLEEFTRLDAGSLTFEAVIIDNNSSDNTREVVKSFADRLPVRYLYQPEAGKNRALNLALDEAELGDIIVFADDDITPVPQWLQAIAATCDRWPDHAMFGGKIDIVWPIDDLPTWVEDPGIRAFAFAAHDYADEEKEYEGRHVPFGPNYWVRSSVFEDGRRFNEAIGPQPKNRIMGDETLFMRAFVDEGNRVVYSPDAAVGHRIQKEMVTYEGVMNRAHQFGRTVTHLLGVEQQELLDRQPILWWIVRSAAVVRCALRYWVGKLVSSPARKVPRAVRHLRDLSHQLESMRLAWSGDAGAAVSPVVYPNRSEPTVTGVTGK
ncbi:MAG: glycosyltransferase [Planctomycetota bacterium]